jgi:hypothetical protein
MSTPTGGGRHAEYYNHEEHEEPRKEPRSDPFIAYHGTLLTEVWEAGRQVQDAPPTVSGGQTIGIDKEAVHEPANNDALRQHFQSTHRTSVADTARQHGALPLAVTNGTSTHAPLEGRPATSTISASGDDTAYRPIRLHFYDDPGQTSGRSREEALSIIATAEGGSLTGGMTQSPTHEDPLTFQPQVPPPLPASLASPYPVAGAPSGWNHTVILSGKTEITFTDISYLHHLR